MKNLELFLDKIMQIKPGQKLLIITDTYARPMRLGHLMMELACDRQIETVMSVMEPRAHQGHEPPKAIAKAMLDVDVIFEVAEAVDCTHTTARKNASEAGVKYFLTVTLGSEDDIKRKVTLDDLEMMRDRTTGLADKLQKAKVVRVTTPFGTDLSMNIAGRSGLPIYPSKDAPISMLPDYAEVAISPNEGTSEGVIVVDAGVREWGYLFLREPLHITVAKGRIETVRGAPKDVDRFEEMLAKDQGAKNCAAELGIGTSHTVSKNISGNPFDYALLGTVHIGVGRNNDIGGATFSQIHTDVLVTKPTIVLDGEKIMEQGEPIF